MVERATPNRAPREYDDIPGTYVFDADHSRRGYALNMFCMSLNNASNRQRFAEDPVGYLAGHALTEAQREAVLTRDWLGMLRLGGNIYYTFKLAICDGLTMQDVGGAMSGMTRDAFAEMMVGGGRPVDGNRSIHQQKAS